MVSPSFFSFEPYTHFQCRKCNYKKMNVGKFGKQTNPRTVVLGVRKKSLFVFLFVIIIIKRIN